MHEKITLPNGVRILFEKIPHVRSVSCGIWVGAGSRYEKASENGASHFIEHMVFKGTKTRSAQQLAAVMDELGGQINAFTAKEHTCFHGRVPDTRTMTLCEILCDLFFDSVFSETDVRNECGVICEEIDMYEDTPEDLVTERLMSAVYAGTSLARPILGSKRSLRKMDGEFLRSFMKKHYSASSTVVAVCGSVSDEAIEYLKARFSELPKSRPVRLSAIEYVQAFTAKRKSIEQNHLALGFPGIGLADRDRFAMQLMSMILGGGMSSRLFQAVREKRGLCYGIDSFSGSFIGTGFFAVCTALGKDTELKALGVIKDEILRFTEYGVTEDELRCAREQIKANILMSLELTNSRMFKLGKNELFFGFVPTTDETLAAFDAVTADDISNLACRCLDFGRLSFSAVGRVSEEDGYRKILSV